MTDTDTSLLPWRIEWRGHSWSESDLIGQHLAVLALITGSDEWTALDMDPRLGHQRLMMMITACMVVDTAENPEDAEDVGALVAQSMEQVSSAPIDEILGALKHD